MRLRINLAIATLALVTIVWGIRFSVAAQERRRAPEFLQYKYQQLNRTFFANSLPTATVEWAELSDADNNGQTIRKNAQSFVVLVDRSSNPRAEDLQNTIEHQTCHIATWAQDEDPHGLSFQDCMAAIKADEP